MKSLLKVLVIVLTTLLLFGGLVSIYVFNKLDAYKKEIMRMHNYQRNVMYRQQEDIQILFNRINHNDTRWQDMEERLNKAEYRLNHRY